MVGVVEGALLQSNASVPVVVDFLIHLRQDKGLSVSAVKGYCSALIGVGSEGVGIWPLLARLRPCFVVSRDRLILLSCVHLRGTFLWYLQSLTGPPYEPLRTCEERFLAQKTLFLLALASAKRIESLIPGTGVRFPLLLSLVLWPRTQDPSSLAPRFEGFFSTGPNKREKESQWETTVSCAGSQGLTSTALLHIVHDVSGCLSPQGVVRRRFRRPRSPSGSGRRYHALTSSLGRRCQCPPHELVRRVVSLRQFFSERILLSTRC